MTTILDTGVPAQPESGSTPVSKAIRTENLTKNYGRNRGILDLNLEVGESEIFGFLGPNGAGKTTTIRLLMNLIKPTSGSAAIFGLDSQHDSVEIKRFTGYLPGEFALYPNLTGAQTLEYFANLRGGVGWKVIAELADRFDLDLSKKFRSYSHGNKQKVGIIQAIMHHPRLLILDEPTNGLDPLNQQEFYRLVKELREEGTTVFLSSHILSEVETICDRVALVRDGRLIKVGGISELIDLKKHQLEITFNGPAPVEVFRALPGVSRVELVNKEGTEIMRCTVTQEELGAAIKTAAGYEIGDLVSREPSLEEVFLDFYGKGGENS